MARVSTTGAALRSYSALQVAVSDDEYYYIEINNFWLAAMFNSGWMNS